MNLVPAKTTVNTSYYQATLGSSIGLNVILTIILAYQGAVGPVMLEFTFNLKLHYQGAEGPVILFKSTLN